MVRTKNKGQRTKDRVFGGLTTFPSTIYQLPITNSGFTFIELLIAIGIIGVLSTLFIATYPATQRRARDAERRSDIKQYQTAMEAYANSHSGNYPDWGASAVSIYDSAYCSTSLGLPTCPNDPSNDYQAFSASASYVIWAQLEQKNDSGNVIFYIVCSTGEVGEKTSAPTSAACPL